MRDSPNQKGLTVERSFKVLWLLPGELRTLLDELQISLSSSSPLHGNPAMESHSEARGREAILKDLGGDFILPELRTALEAAAEPSRCLRIFRGERRQAPEILRGVFHTQLADSLAVIQTYPDGSAHLLFPFSLSSLAEWLAKPFRHIALPEVPLSGLPSYGTAALTVFLGLGDFFGKTYPDPDAEWRPDRQMSFTCRELYAVLNGGWSGENGSSLIRGFESLTGVALPSFDLEQLEAQLLMLTNEGLLGRQEVDGAEDGYWMAQSLVWMERCLAWWDLSLRVENEESKALNLIQASALWSFDVKNSDAKPSIMMTAIGGADLAKRIEVILAPTGLDEPPPLPSQEVTVAPSLFCSKCGQSLAGGVRFCRACGTAVQPQSDPADCPSCGVPRKPGVKFCGGCGRKLGE